MVYENDKVKVEVKSFSCNGSGLGTLIETIVNNTGDILNLFIYPKGNSLGLKYSLHLGDKIVLLNIKEDGTYLCPNKINGEEIKGPINIGELEKMIENSIKTN
jgi:hypothetical protein